MEGDEGTLPLLEAVPDLSARLDDEARGRVGTIRVRVVGMEPGPLDVHGLADDDVAPLGLLVVGGALSRSVEVGGRRAVELVGEGDLVWPWQDETLAEPAVPLAVVAPRRANSGLVVDALVPPDQPAARWGVVTPARLALLDARVAALIGRLPALAGELLERAARRARALAAQLAIAQIPRVDVRLHAFLWHLADRHGRVRTDGVLLPLPLTHELIAGLVGARRPSVTTALGELARRGAVARVADGWLLHRDVA
ncbi:MAG TPA: helix-turn-helix domain-containing protein [Solirubrobacteraceae bacterium]|nr:helix-turn-helix domain-containing protein [Solirubrobacteraceae bacterium]